MTTWVTAGHVDARTAIAGTAVSSVVLGGHGQLATAILAQLRSSTTVVTADLHVDDIGSGDGRLVVIALDHPDVDQLLAANATCLTAAVAFLPVWLELDEARIGPLTLPGQHGCLACAERRRLHNRPQAALFREALRRTAMHCPANPWALRCVIDAVAERVAGEIERVLSGVPDLHRAFSVLRLATLESERHAVLPDAFCDVCGTVADDHPTPDAFALDVPVWTQPDRWRAVDLGTRLDSLKEAFVSPRAGLVTTLGVDTATPLCAVATSTFRVAGREHEEWGAGLTHSFQQSQAVSIVEALERYAGLQPRGKRTAVFERYGDVRGDALDPRMLVLYAPSQYAGTRFGCVPFDDDLRCAWVWGYSFGQRRPILVPEQCVFYGLPQPRQEPRFIVESSSGCALGSSMSEAIFYGLLEQIERDAVLRTWFARQTPRRWEPSAVCDTTVLNTIDRLTETTGYELHVLDARQEIDVPAIWLVAVNPRANEHRLLCTSRAHIDLDAAIAGALGELCGTLLYHRQQYERRHDELVAMSLDSDLVRDRLDHSLLAGLPEIADRFEFLFGGDAMGGTAIRHEGPRDLTAAAARLIAQVVGHGFDVIAIDQTTPEQTPFDFRTVKVMVPGFVPMSYSQRYRRADEAPRLREYTPLNPYPHPFA